jgi:hypothetical protein
MFGLTSRTRLARPGTTIRKIVWAGLSLYLGQLLLAPLAHQAAHASELRHPTGCSELLDRSVAQVRMPCALPCNDASHHHGGNDEGDHSHICSTCSNLSAPAHTGSAPFAALHARAIEQAHLVARSCNLAILASAASPRAPPALL